MAFPFNTPYVNNPKPTHNRDVSDTQPGHIRFEPGFDAWEAADKLMQNAEVYTKPVE